LQDVEKTEKQFNNVILLNYTLIINLF